MKNKSNKLSNLDQLDGKLAGGQKSKVLSSLLASDFSFQGYCVDNEEDYSEYINSLNSTDLQRHAEKIGLVPSVERRVLKERLTREFKKFLASRSVVSDEQIAHHMNRDSSGSDLSAQAKKILREGC